MADNPPYSVWQLDDPADETRWSPCEEGLADLPMARDAANALRQADGARVLVIRDGAGKEIERLLPPKP
jgi:hypothetical protein